MEVRLRELMYIVGCLLSAAQVSADDSVLGLPVPDDVARHGTVLLHGGGRVTDDVFDRFVELAGGKNASIVLVPSAGYRVVDFLSEADFVATVSRRYGSWVGLKMTRRVRDFKFLYTDDPDDADNEEFVKPLEQATGVWFSGGYQSRLNYRFVGEFPEKTRFQEALRRVVSRGGVVGGTSAGTAAIPEIMTLWEDRETIGAPATAITAHGLGLFDQAIVEQHFDARGGRLERFTRLLKDNARLDELAGRKRAGEQMLGIGIEETAALVIRGNQLNVIGKSNVHLFLKGNGGRSLTWHDLAPGDTAQLVRGVPTEVIIGREEVVLRKR